MNSPKTLKSIQDELDLFVDDLRKEASMKEGERPDTDQLTKAPNPEADNLGKEQSQDLEETVQRPKTEPIEAGEDSSNALTPDVMDIDTKAEGNSKRITKVKNEEKTMQQKTAAMERLGKGLVDMLEKAASEEQNKEAGAQTKDEKYKGIPEEMVKIASERSEQYFNRHLAGMVKRAQDEAYLQEQGVDKDVASKLLDKLAMEDPAAVLPEEVIQEADAMAPVEGEASVSPEDETAAIVEAMDAMGVTPEMLEQAMTLVEDLKGQGFTEEEIASQALQMLEESAPEAPVEEAPVEEAPVEEDMEEDMEEDVEKEAMQKIAAALKANRKQTNKQKMFNMLRPAK